MTNAPSNKGVISSSGGVISAASALNDIMTAARPVSDIHPSLGPLGRWMRERLIKSIVDFEAKLTPAQEIAGRIVNCPGPEGSFHIVDIGYWGDMVIFHGRTFDGLPMELLQHHSQVNVLLIAVSVEDGSAKRIGFELSAKL